MSSRPPTLLLAFLVLGRAASAQEWTFRPVFALSAGYNSNVAYIPGERLSDYYLGVSVKAPLTAMLSRSSSLTADYSAGGEWYRDRTAFNAFPSRQDASLTFTHTSGEAWKVALNGSYAESRRPEDLFPQAGVAYLRGKTRNPGAGATFSHRLGGRSGFDLDYRYTRPFYEGLNRDRFDQASESHNARTSLRRSFSKRTSISARYEYQLYLRDELPRDESQVVGLDFKHTFGRATTLSLFGGARFAGDDASPEGSLTLAHAWRSSQLGIGYSRSRNYVPTTLGFTETDFASLHYSIAKRRFRASWTAGYARNRFEQLAELPTLSRDYGSYRGAFDTVYMMWRSLGLGATYQYDLDQSQTAGFRDRERHLVQLGLVVIPWPGKDVPNLR